MFVFTLKTSRKQLVSLAVCVVMLLTAVTVAALTPSGSPPPDGSSQTARVALLRSLGYTALPESEVQEAVTVPDTFDSVMTAYNALQQTAGMDLSPYRGQALCGYRYTVTAGDASLIARLWVRDGTVVGGDIADGQPGGFQSALIARTPQE